MVDFGTTDPIVTLNAAGTWLIIPLVQIQTIGATFAASQIITCAIRRINNTATNLSGSSVNQRVRVMTTATEGVPYTMTPFLYTTPRTDDQIQPYIDIAVLPSAGSIIVNRANIVAILLAPSG